MKVQQRTGFEQFAESPSRQRLVEQESLILEATELLSTLMGTESISKAELARRLGRSKAYVTQALNGRANLTLRTLADLGWALGYRLRFQAKNVNSGCWVALPDVPHFYPTRQGRTVACWRGFPHSVEEGERPESADVHNAEILPLSA